MEDFFKIEKPGAHYGPRERPLETRGHCDEGKVRVISSIGRMYNIKLILKD